MPVDLRAILAAPELGATLLVGESLEREVTGVITTDLHDPRRYLHGGELVLTGMVWRRDEADAEAFVDHLASAGVAALGAGDPDRVDIPADLVDACRRHGLPLIAVSRDVSFSTITEYVVRRMSAGRSADLAAVLGRHRSLIETGGGLGVLALVSGELGMRCWVVTAAGRLVQGTGEELSADDSASIAADVAAGDRLPRRMRVHRGRGYSLFGAGRPPYVGWLLVVDDDHTHWPPERRDVTDELVAMVDLEFSRWLHAAEVDDVFAALDDDPAPNAVAARLRMTGLDPARPLVLAVASASGEPFADLLPATLAEAVGPATERFVWFRHDGGVGLIGQPAEGGSAPLDHAGLVLDRVTPALARAGVRLSIGISDPAEAFEGLAGALAEARQAGQIAALRSGPATVVGPDQLRSHVLLLASVPGEVRQAFRSRVLDPLVEYDERHTSELVRTLEVYLDCAGSWSRAAAELHVHVNTLRYRVERIERLTGRDLRRLPDLVDLHLALQLR